MLLILRSALLLDFTKTPLQIYTTINDIQIKKVHSLYYLDILFDGKPKFDLQLLKFINNARRMIGLVRYQLTLLTILLPL